MCVCVCAGGGAGHCLVAMAAEGLETGEEAREGPRRLLRPFDLAEEAVRPARPPADPRRVDPRSFVRVACIRVVRLRVVCVRGVCFRV